MLVLTRKTEQKIQIGPDVTITILRVRGQSVRIGIDAPQSVRVLRAELPPREQFDNQVSTADEQVVETAGAGVADAEQLLRSKSVGQPFRGLPRDRSAAGSMPRLHPSAGDRPAHQPGATPPAGRLAPAVPRISSSLADRVAARRGGEKLSSTNSLNR